MARPHDKTNSAGCDILNKLWERNCVTTIEHICSYLSWPKISEIGQVVNFDLMSCLRNKKKIKTIFLLNTRFHNSTQIVELNYKYLLDLQPKHLMNHYQLIHQNPSYKRFSDISSTTAKITVLMKFNPVWPVCAVVHSPDKFAILAYDIHSPIRSKCAGTGIISQQKIYGDSNEIMDISWSPKGNFLCVVSRKNYYAQPPSTRNYKECRGDCKGKLVQFFHFDPTIGRLLEFKILGRKKLPTRMCLFHQSSHLWNDDNLVTFIDHESGKLQRLVLNSQNKTITVYTLAVNLKNLFDTSTEKFICLISCPTQPHTLAFKTVCPISSHFHHRIHFFDLVSSSTLHISHIPGFIHHIAVDPILDEIVVVYMCHMNFISDSLTNNQTPIASCPFQSKPEVQLHPQLDNYDSFYVQMRAINLKNFEERDLVHSRYIKIMY